MGASLRPMKPWALAMLVVGVSAGKPPLRLRHDGTFSIVQVADVHTGEGEASSLSRPSPPSSATPPVPIPGTLSSGRDLSPPSPLPSPSPLSPSRSGSLSVLLPQEGFLSLELITRRAGAADKEVEEEEEEEAVSPTSAEEMGVSLPSTTKAGERRRPSLGGDRGGRSDSTSSESSAKWRVPSCANGSCSCSCGVDGDVDIAVEVDVGVCCGRCGASEVASEAI